LKRTLPALTEREFDVLVIGGGAFGAAAAWDASLRGLNVALIDQADFGSGASAECFKMVHGGIRYLQHADIRRLRSSCHERSALLRIAPHLVKPLPIVVPTFGRGRKGKLFLGTGMYLYDLLSVGRNAGIKDRSRRIPLTHFMSRHELLEVFPELEQDSLSGGAIFADGQMYNAARLVLAFVKSAERKGATAANYVRAETFLWEDRAVRGVKARDCLGGAEFDIRARLVLNAAGPWAEYLLSDASRFGQHRRGPFSRDAYFIVKRPPRSSYALAVPGQSRDRDTLVSRTARHLFAVPWRDYTLIGVWHRPFRERPNTAMVEDRELDDWIEEMNLSHPALGLRRDEICFACCGLVPFGSNSSDLGELSFGKESRYIDHRHTHGITGLVTLIGIRYTTARADSATALDLLLQQWPGRAPLRAPTARIPLVGGNIDDMAALRAQAMRARPASISVRSVEALLCNHGTEFDALLTRASASAETERLDGTDTLLAEVTHAANCEMAVHLEDVVLRRTNLGSGAHPGRLALEQAAHKLQQLLGWSEQRREQELNATELTLRHHHAVALNTAVDTAVGSPA
jgi:glycerol-3-phosphate dehydrogenase